MTQTPTFQYNDLKNGAKIVILFKIIVIFASHYKSDRLS